jgi:hypothetical protein
MRCLFAACLLVFLSLPSHAQYWSQYFDGSDTSVNNSLFVTFDEDSTNVWQIGKPQKFLFDTAATEPNVLVTDTLNPYPVNNTSRAYVSMASWWGWWGILAFQWKQKLDMDTVGDGGVVEFSVDSGQTWQSAFDNPYVYNFYGFDGANVDTLSSGEIAFTGTDTVWRDVWLCFDNMFLNQYDTVQLRFKFVSDPFPESRDGWMIDNLMGHITIVHTAKGDKPNSQLRAFPSVTDGRIYIEGEKMLGYQVIESIELTGPDGRVYKRYGKSPMKFFVDISDQVNGLYFLTVSTNLEQRTFPVLLMKP